jgi:disulfide bond formation protein DsbB
VMAAPVVRCDVVPWSLFGISMAGYNVVISLALGALALVAARRTLLTRTPR